MSGLKPATEYVIRLAAVNQAGRGPFSSTRLPVTTLPSGTILQINFQPLKDNLSYAHGIASVLFTPSHCFIPQGTLRL